MYKRIALSAGHYPKRKGACHNNFCEHSEAVRWVKELKDDLEARGLPVVVVKPGPLKKKVAQVNDAKAGAAIEVHFNACGGCNASGCETLYGPGSGRGKRLAEAVHTPLVVAMGVRNRGIKEGWWKMDRPGKIDYAGDKEGDETPMYFLRATNCPALILEPEFIHNKGIIQIQRKAACAAIGRALWKVFR